MEIKQSIYFDIKYIPLSITRKLNIGMAGIRRSFLKSRTWFIGFFSLFTWAQLLEAVDLGKISSGIKKSLA